jgi:uncharacterized membrane protein YfcA
MIENIFHFFDMGLMVSIIVITYAIFKLLKYFKIDWQTWIKRLTTMLITAILSTFYHYVLGLELEKIVPTYLISVIFYDYLIKVVMDKVKHIE